jgi:hypothetical protein
MMNLLSRSDQIFRKLLSFNVSVLLAMSLQRLVLFLLVVRHWIFGSDGTVIGNAFLTGARFDLCVLGFLSIPALCIVWLICTDTLIHSKNPAVQSLRKWILWFYLGAVTLVIHVLGLLDLLYFANTGHRWTFADWQGHGLGFIAKTSERWGWIFTLGVVAVFILLWVVRCLFALYKVQLHTAPIPEGTTPSRIKLWCLGAILPVLVVAFAARGTWTPHHLERQDAQISPIASLNQLALSPLWIFDKTF